MLKLSGTKQTTVTADGRLVTSSTSRKLHISGSEPGPQLRFESKGALYVDDAPVGFFGPSPQPTEISLLNLVREQQQKINALEARLTKLEKKNGIE